MTPVSFWFRMVSSATAVLPVWRSPMISSRWPRPIGTMPSIALRPVCIGSRTGCRSTTPGAMRSIGANCLVRIGPLPSIGWPSALTTRPSISSPTGTEMMRPVRLTGIAFLDRAVLAQQHGADAVLFEVQRDAERPRAGTRASRRPWRARSRAAAAMPSPSDVTVPTSATSTSTAKLPIWSRMILEISSDRMLIGRLSALGDQLVAHLLQLRPDAAVVDGAAHSRHDAAEQRRIDATTRIVICLPVALAQAGRERLGWSRRPSGAAVVTSACTTFWCSSSRSV